MYRGPYGSFAKLNALLSVAACVGFLITAFTSSSLIDELRLLLVCGGAAIVFNYVSKLLMDTSHTAHA
jgi:hypothetical protein